MNIHILVMQVNGEVTDRQKTDTATIRSRGPAHRLVERCHEVLHDHLPETIVGPFKFTADVLKQPRVTIRWQQIDPFSASAMLLADGEPASLLWALSGCQPDCDEMAVHMMADCQTALRGCEKIEPGGQCVRKPGFGFSHTLRVPFNVTLWNIRVVECKGATEGELIKMRHRRILIRKSPWFDFFTASHQKDLDESGKRASGYPRAASRNLHPTGDRGQPKICAAGGECLCGHVLRLFRDRVRLREPPVRSGKRPSRFQRHSSAARVLAQLSEIISQTRVD